MVRIFNARGQCLAGAVLTEEVRPGVAVMQTGAWYDPVPGAYRGCVPLAEIGRAWAT